VAREALLQTLAASDAGLRGQKLRIDERRERQLQFCICKAVGWRRLAGEI